VEYAENMSLWNVSNYNFSFGIDWVGEFTPGGQLVRLASPLSPYAGTANVTVGAREVNLTARYLMNVTNASGTWTPNDTWAGTGPQWKISTSNVGTALMNVVFHLENVPVNASANGTRNASLSVKFDVGIASWPWASSSDLLGFDLESLGAWGAHFAYDPENRTMSEEWNQTNQTFVSLVFGSAAGVQYNATASATSTVGEQVGLFPAGIPDRESVALVTFGGVVGNYSYVSYDPWVVFSIGGWSVPPVNKPSPTDPFTDPVLAPVAGAVVAAVAGISVMALYVVRASMLRREGLSLVRDMRDALSEGPNAPARPK
jgi:roadblock/LC7 domain-containing protein